MFALAILAGLPALVWGAVYLRFRLQVAHASGECARESRFQTAARGNADPSAWMLCACLLLLLIGSCFGFEFFHVSAGPLPWTADRALHVLLFLGYLALRWTRRVESRGIDRADLLFAGLIVTLAASALTHDWRAHGAQPLATWVFFFLQPAFLYLISRSIQPSARAAGGLYLALAVFAGYLALIGLAEQSGHGPLVFPRYIASPKYTEFLGRARGPFLNPCANGLYMTVGLCGITLLWSNRRAWQRVLLAALFVLILLGIRATLTRSVWLGAAVALAVIGFATIPTRWRIPSLAALAVAGCLVLAVKWSDWREFKRDRNVSVSDMAKSATLRPILATVAWHMFLDRPLLGCGFGQYKTEAKPYLSDRSTPLPLERARPYVQHNVFLALLVETGLLGLGLYLAWLARAAICAWRVWRHAEFDLPRRKIGLLFLGLLASLAVNGMFHDVGIIPMVNMLLFFLAGMVRGSTPAPRFGGVMTRAPASAVGVSTHAFQG